MRLLLAAAVIALLIVLGAGLLPPLFARGSLDEAAVTAARAGSAALAGGPLAADAAAQRSMAAYPDMHIVSMQPNPDAPNPVAANTFQITVSENVRNFMSKIPWLRGWFTLTSTQQSTLGT